MNDLLWRIAEVAQMKKIDTSAGTRYECALCLEASTDGETIPHYFRCPIARLRIEMYRAYCKEVGIPWD